MPVYHGSCHCGTVTFKVDADITELTTCDCSLCRKKNAMMFKVPEDALTLLTGKDRLTLYRWNTEIAAHYFCKDCGIYTFHRKRAQPDHFGVNFAALDDFTDRRPPVRQAEGANMTVVADAARNVWPGPRNA